MRCLRLLVWPALVALVLAACATRTTVSPALRSSSGFLPRVVQSGGGESWEKFDLPGYDPAPRGIASGPYGNLWFAEERTNEIARISLAGIVTSYPIPTANSGTQWLAEGSDTIWFTEENSLSPKIGSITPAGVITEYPYGGGTDVPWDIVQGSDKNMWFTTLGNDVGRITPSGSINAYSVPTQGTPGLATLGPDGAVWFTEGCTCGDKIVKVTPSGTFSVYAIPTANAQPQDITSGSNGDLYFTEGNANKIGQITPGGVITEYQNPQYAYPIWIAQGPNNQVWFSVTGGFIGRFNEKTHTFLTELFPPNSGAADLVRGPDGNMWFTDGGGASTDWIGVWVYHVLTVSPTSVTVSPGSNQMLSVAETHFLNPSYVASSSKTRIATVRAGNSVGQFVVTGVATGSCDVTVRDPRGNSVIVPVSVQ